MAYDQDVSNERVRPDPGDTADPDGAATASETEMVEAEGRQEQAPDTRQPSAEVSAEPTDTRAEGGDALLSPEDTVRLQRRWGDIQSRFVDDPRQAVEAADGLVAELMDALTARFTEHRSVLEAQWQRGDDVDTEQLRRALRDYRAFFERLLTA
jgi:hypothetical protein